MTNLSTIVPGAVTELSNDTTPQLGGDLDLNGNSIDFPSTPNISDVKDENNMASDSATMLATQQSIKAYTDTSSAAASAAAVASATSDVVDDTTPQLGGDLDMNGKSITITPTAGGSDETESGIIATLTAGETLAFGEVCYLKSDGKYWLADSSDDTAIPAVVMALGAISADASGSFLKRGFLRDDSYSWTVGGLLYASTTGGAISQTAPSGSGQIVQVLGYAYSATVIYFSPNLGTLEI